MRRVRGQTATNANARGTETLGFAARFLRGLLPDGSSHDRRSVVGRVRMTSGMLPMLMLAEIVAGAGLFAARGLGSWSVHALNLFVVPLMAMILSGGAVLAMTRAWLYRSASPARRHFAVAAYALVQGLCWSVWLAGFSDTAAVGTPGWIVYCSLVVIGTVIFTPIPIAVALLWLTAVVSALLHVQSVLAGGLLVALTAVGVLALGGISERSYRASRRWFDSATGALKAATLLREFEENRRGWFWETDARGNLTYISAQLAAAISLPVERLLGKPITDLVLHEQDAGDVTAQGERTLGFHLSTRLAFSEIAVRGSGMNEVCWWALSGRPAFDEDEVFLGFRGSGTDLTEMRRSEAEVKRLASYDALTGLPNRILMRRTLDESLRDVAGRPKRTALFMLDLDRFKMVNDTLGHPVGDALLRLVAERLTRVVQSEGQVGRLGGDEFNVVLPGIVDRARLAFLADAIIHQISKPYIIEGAHVSIGASVGIAIAPDDGASADALVRNADLALYAAKGDGKGVHRFYEPAMHASAKDRRLLEMDLRKAMAERGLHLMYQPVVDACSEAVVGFEALARWNHPTRGMVSPTDFIPIAEEIGLIQQIGEWVLRTACLEASNWPENVRVAVNISPIQFANPALPGTVLSALAAAQIAPDRLELEITEGVFLNDDEATDVMFARLKAIGVRFALDDFGTGYSSLGYLKKAPFNKIKIDQSFVRGAAVPGNRNAAIIRAIVALAESLEMETTAEGAETPDELALIRSLGCSHIQGYIFGRPMSKDDARTRVAGTGKLSMPELLVTREPRVAMLRSVTLHSLQGVVSARIRNLSRTGAMIECGSGFAPGTQLALELPDGTRIAGFVRWADSDRFGVAFDEPVEVEQVMVPPRALRSGTR